MRKRLLKLQIYGYKNICYGQKISGAYNIVNTINEYILFYTKINENNF